VVPKRNEKKFRLPARLYSSSEDEVPISSKATSPCQNNMCSLPQSPIEGWLLSNKSGTVPLLETCSCHCTDKYSAFFEIAQK